MLLVEGTQLDVLARPGPRVVEQNALNARTGRSKVAANADRAVGKGEQQVVGTEAHDPNIARLDAAGEDQLVDVGCGGQVYDHVVAVAGQVDVAVAAAAADENIIALVAL
jgi:hypothetical protein